jgi:hypothetical protein
MKYEISLTFFSSHTVLGENTQFKGTGTRITIGLKWCGSIYFVVRFSSEFCSSFVQLWFSFDSFAFSLFSVRCLKEKYSILILDCIPGISILLYHCTRSIVIIYASQ